MIDLFASQTAAGLFLSLLHFLWQGTLLACGLVIVLRLLPVKRTRERCAVSFYTLCAMLACPVVTFVVVKSSHLSESPATTPSAFSHVGGADMTVPSTELVSSQPVDHVPLLAVDVSTQESKAVATKSDSPIAGKTSPTNTPRRGQTWGLAVWMAGVCVMALRLIFSFAWTVSLHHGKRPIEAALLSRVRQLATEVGLSATPRVWVSPRVRHALVTGYLRPAIWLPATWISELPPDVLEAVLAHELAHIKRLDVWMILLQRITETVLFYHPGVWWVSRCLTRQRELCCDTAAVLATGAPRRYAAALEQIARKQWSARNPALTPSIGGHQMELLARVKHVLTITPESSAHRPFVTRHHSGVLLASLFALVTVTGAILACGVDESDQKSFTIPDATAETTASEKESTTNSDQAAARARLVAKRVLPKRPRPDSLFDLRSIETIDDQLLGDMRRLSHEARSATLGRSLTNQEQMKRIATLEHLEHLTFVHADLEKADLQILKTMPNLLSLMIVKGTLSLATELKRPGARIEGWKIDLRWQDARKINVALLAAADGQVEFMEQNSPIGSITFHQLSLHDDLRTVTATRAILDELHLRKDVADRAAESTTLLAESLFIEREEDAPFQLKQLHGTNVVLRTTGRNKTRLSCDTLFLKNGRLYFASIGGISRRVDEARGADSSTAIEESDSKAPVAETAAVDRKSPALAPLITVAYSVSDVLGSYTKPIPVSSNSNRTDTRVQRASEILAHMIIEHIAPESWKQNGGEGSLSVHEETRTLVIRQRQLVHDQISAFLTPLRRLVTGPTADRATFNFGSSNDRQADPVLINVAADGQLSLDDDNEAITLGELRSELQKRNLESATGAGKGSQLIEIRADRAVPYQVLLKIIKLCNEVKTPVRFGLSIDTENSQSR